jgi:hypothetical protein
LNRDVRRQDFRLGIRGQSEILCFLCDFLSMLPDMNSLFEKMCRTSDAIIASALLLLAAALLMLTSCASSPSVQKVSTTAYREGVPGGTLVETYKITVNVREIDPANRKVTLVAADGTSNTFTALPGDRTFDQLKVDEQVQATVTRQLVVFLRRNGAALNSAPMIDAGLAPDITKPDALKSDTVQRVARVSAVDRKHRQATLDFMDGTSQRFNVRRDVNLEQVQSGEEVVIRTTSAVVLTLEKK